MQMCGMCTTRPLKVLCCKSATRKIFTKGQQTLYNSRFQTSFHALLLQYLIIFTLSQIGLGRNHYSIIDY
jgi:hypothetical protein